MLIRYRRYFTTGIAFTFTVVGLTGIYFKFLPRTPAMEQIHGWLGLALVAGAVFHVSHNWNSLRAHLQSPRVWLLLALVLAVCVYFGATVPEKPRGGSPKDIVSKLTHAHLSDLARVFGRDPRLVLGALQRDGIQPVGADPTVADIAQRAQKSPEFVLSYFVR